MGTASGLDIRQLHREADRDGVAKLVVGAVVHSGGRVLVLRRSPDDSFMAGIEELPSGGVEKGEGLLAALERELAEEIGWDGPLVLDPGFVTHFDYVSGSGRKVRQYTFGLGYLGKAIVLSGEHTGYRWLQPDDVAYSDVTPETARTIRRWAAARPVGG